MNNATKLFRPLIWAVLLLVVYLLFIIVFKDRSDYVSNLTFYERGTQAILRADDISTQENHDVLFVGSSHTYRGFDTDFLRRNDINSHILSSGSQSPLNSYYLLKSQLEASRANPKLIVFETYWGVNGLDGLESGVEIVNSFPLDASLLRMSIEIGHINPINTFFANALHGQLYGNNERLDAARARYDTTYSFGGYLQSDRTIDTEKVKEPRKNTSGFWQKQAIYVPKVIDLANEYEIPIIFVKVPISDELRIATTRYPQIATDIDNLAQEYGVNNYNLNDEEYLDKLNLKTNADFYDYSHLNHNGVTKINPTILEILKENLSSSDDF